MSSWQALDEEVARWRAAGRRVDLWWRDDDAIDATQPLDRLIGIHRDSGAALALAVVSAGATQTLARRLADETGIDVLQHGYGHFNHAGTGEKKMELGGHRPAMIVLGEMATGWLALERVFASRALAVMVPPWNRIAPALLPSLPEIGFVGLSAFGPRSRPEPARRLRQVNAHVDLIDWRGERGFVGEANALTRLVQSIAWARNGPGEHAAEPIGILTHHLAMDEPAWDFLQYLLERVTKAPGIAILPARDLFASREARA